MEQQGRLQVALYNMNNEEKAKEVIKRIKDLSDQKVSLLNIINGTAFDETLSYTDNFKDLLLIEQSLRSEFKVLTTDQEML